MSCADGTKRKQRERSASQPVALMVRLNGAQWILRFPMFLARNRRLSGREMKQAQALDGGADAPPSCFRDQNQLSMRFVSDDDIRDVCANRGQNDGRIRWSMIRRHLWFHSWQIRGLVQGSSLSGKASESTLNGKLLMYLIQDSWSYGSR